MSYISRSHQKLRRQNDAYPLDYGFSNRTFCHYLCIAVHIRNQRMYDSIVPNCYCLHMLDLKYVWLDIGGMLREFITWFSRSCTPSCLQTEKIKFWEASRLLCHITIDWWYTNGLPNFALQHNSAFSHFSCVIHTSKFVSIPFVKAKCQQLCSYCLSVHDTVQDCQLCFEKSS